MEQRRKRVSKYKQNPDKILDVYENIIIGNFLFGLGVKLGMQHHAFPIEPTSVNLLQQQNLDKRLGDVMIANAHIIRLIEFKRAGNTDTKEMEKWDLIDTALRGKEFSNLHEISRKIHWYVESDFRNEKSAETIGGRIDVQPYLDFPNSTISDSYMSLDEFIDKTAKESMEFDCEEDEFSLCQMYIEMIASLFGDSSGFSKCLLLTIKGSGQLSYVAVDDVGDILKTPKLAIQRQLERQVRLVREREFIQEQELERHRMERTQERQIEREGPSLGY